MTSSEAEELAKFRRMIGKATLEELAPLLLTTLDELIDVARALPSPRGFGLEVAAALAAELHRRRPAVAWAAIVGNA